MRRARLRLAEHVDEQDPLVLDGIILCVSFLLFQVLMRDQRQNRVNTLVILLFIHERHVDDEIQVVRNLHQPLLEITPLLVFRRVSKEVMRTRSM